ncbi:MAG: VRR-NUC domain-containing protein [Rhodobacteraceae bacterium]|nr:VRR-NUC domain-containing protein [Paracoccaceae bacterium]
MTSAEYGNRFKRQLKTAMAESELQQGVFAALLSLEVHGQNLVVAHIPNEGRRSPRQGMRMRREGLRRGAPDLVVWLRGGKTLNIELKTVRGKLSSSQASFGRGLNSLGGHEYVVVFAAGVKEALDEILPKITEMLSLD